MISTRKNLKEIFKKMKNPQQKFIAKSLLVLLLSIFAISSTNDANANMFNRFKKGFYFEKYKTAEEARVALLELHPVGSDVGELVKTLERAGAKVTQDSEESLKNYKKFKQYDEWWKDGTTKIYHYSYDKASPFFVVLNNIEWRGGIWINKSNKVTFLSANKGRAY